MAHTGKFYPVHFRRDLNYNCRTNNRGLPRAWKITFDNKGGTVGIALQGKTLYALAASERSFLYADWEGDFKPVAGRMIRLQFQITDIEGEVGKGPSLRIIDSVHGTLALYKPFIVHLTSYGEITLQWDESVQPHPELYIDPVTRRVVCVAVPWEEFHTVYG